MCRVGIFGFSVIRGCCVEDSSAGEVALLQLFVAEGDYSSPEASENGYGLPAYPHVSVLVDDEVDLPNPQLNPALVLGCLPHRAHGEAGGDLKCNGMEVVSLQVNVTNRLGQEHGPAPPRALPV